MNLHIHSHPLCFFLLFLALCQEFDYSTLAKRLLQFFNNCKENKNTKRKYSRFTNRLANC